MADTVQFELVSPERLLLSDPVEMVVVPGGDGDFGVLPGHAPLISTVRPGIIAIYEGGRPHTRILVSGGFAEVTPERCTVLADEAAPLDAVDRARLARRIDAARRDLEDVEPDARDAAAARLRQLEAMLAVYDREAGR